MVPTSPVGDVPSETDGAVDGPDGSDVTVTEDVVPSDGLPVWPVTAGVDSWVDEVGIIEGDVVLP